MTTAPTPQTVALQFQQAKDATLGQMGRVQRAVFLELCKRVIEMTPVDTGRARGGWHGDVIALTAASHDFAGTPGSATSAAMSSVTDAIARHQLGQDLTLANGVQYITYLNNGSSKQAPAGMTDVAINSFKGVVFQTVGAT